MEIEEEGGELGKKKVGFQQEKGEREGSTIEFPYHRYLLVCWQQQQQQQQHWRRQQR